jgi:uncharacterized protein
MRVIITGGTGLIGRALATALLQRGDDVIVTSRDPRGTSGLPRAVGVVRWDCRSPGELAPILVGADAVVHLVGESIGDGRWSDERKRRIRDSRVDSTEALVEALAQTADRPAVLLQASAVGYYGSQGETELDETAPAGEGFLAEVCREWEAAGEPAEALGVRRAVLRTGVVLARAGGALPRLALPFRLFAGGPVGNGRQIVPWIHLADEVGAMRFLLRAAGASGVFNLAAPEPVSNRELARAVGRALHRPSFLPAPVFALRLLLGEMSELVLSSHNVVPDALAAAGYGFRFQTIEAALHDLLTAKGRV